MEAVLKEIERCATAMLTDKFFEICMESERDPVLKGRLIALIGRSLGEEIGEVTAPRQWERFLKTKRCPKYMKELVTFKVNAYYPNISIPEEKHWVTFEKPDVSN